MPNLPAEKLNFESQAPVSKEVYSPSIVLARLESIFQAKPNMYSKRVCWSKYLYSIVKMKTLVQK